MEQISRIIVDSCSYFCQSTVFGMFFNIPVNSNCTKKVHEITTVYLPLYNFVQNREVKI